MSENGYTGVSENTASSEYGGDGFYLEENFGVLENPEQQLEMNHPSFNYRSHPTEHEVQAMAAHTLRSQPNPMGTATLASNSTHLMSPVLTDSNGPSSRQGTASPTMGHTFPQQQRSHFVPPMLSHTALSQANMQQHYGPMQHTPTATDASKGSSPDMGLAIPAVARAASPSIKIEQHKGGDSPVVSPENLGVNGGKRSRTESNPGRLANSREESYEGDDSDDHYNVSSDGTEGPRRGLDPEARGQAGDSDMPTLKEQDESAQVALKNADVAEWLDRSASGSETGAEALAVPKPDLNKRQRARSAGAQLLSTANLQSLHNAAPDAHIPGPGVLIDEESGESESEMDDELASIDESPPPTTAWQEEPMNDIPGQARPGVYDELPNQPPMYRAKLWQDPLYDSSDPGVKMQPVTANDAIMRFSQRANEMETLSRVATWGTRRMSESDLHSLFHRFSISEAPAESNKSGRDRSSSFLKRLIPRRMNSSGLKLRRTDSNKSNAPPTPIRPTTLEIHGRVDGGSTANLGVPPPNALKRMSSLGKRPKSPRINTGGAVAAMATQIAALGGNPNGSLSAAPTACSSPTGAWNLAKNIKRARSRSDLNGLGLQRGASPTGSDFGGLADMWTRQGGPPLPGLAAPKNDDITSRSGFGDDDEDDDDVEDSGVVMDLSIRPDAIIPTLEGFKANIRQLNPRLPPFMFDRIAQEQLRRFKKLMDFKIKHAQALAMGKCASGKHCTELGGEPTYLPSKSSSREPEMNHTGFSVAGLGPSDDDVNALAEGIVTPAQFPPGVPMPPVKRLPAEFECSLCFKVKKFHKPSDWSKHVHEDVQPFTCTFATCAEPKSFKRKADWVRHENERHRQLEWWMCNMNDCSHKCYRKDNFVQHLVREHKLPEPKVKTTKAGKPAVRGPSSQKARNAKTSGDDGEDSHDEIDQVWRLVEECRHETPKSPKDEPCKFCGNICNTWKKLTVHLAKHMEQISMPVLGVVKQKEVTAETIISPIEQRMASHHASMSPSGSQSPYGGPHSPYGVSMSMGGDIPAGFTSLQPTSAGYFTGAQQSMYARPSSSSYPQPTHAQQLASNYQRAASPFGGSDYSGYGNNGGHSPGFTSINAAAAQQRGYTTNPTTSSAEALYTSSLRAAPTSQPRSSPFQDDGSAFQYVSQQQAYVNSPVTDYTNFAPSTPTSYPQQQHSHMGTPSPTFPPQNQLGGGIGSVSPSPSFTAQQHAQMGVGTEPQMAYGLTSNGGGGDMSAFAQQQAILVQQQRQQQAAVAAANGGFQYQQ